MEQAAVGLASKTAALTCIFVRSEPLRVSTSTVELCLRSAGRTEMIAFRSAGESPRTGLGSFGSATSSACSSYRPKTAMTPGNIGRKDKHKGGWTTPHVTDLVAQQKVHGLWCRRP